MNQATVTVAGVTFTIAVVDGQMDVSIGAIDTADPASAALTLDPRFNCALLNITTAGYQGDDTYVNQDLYTQANASGIPTI